MTKRSPPPNRAWQDDPELKEFGGVIDALQDAGREAAPRRELLTEILAELSRGEAHARVRLAWTWRLMVPVGVAAAVLLLLRVELAPDALTDPERAAPGGDTEQQSPVPGAPIEISTPTAPRGAATQDAEFKMAPAASAPLAAPAPSAPAAPPSPVEATEVKVFMSSTAEEPNVDCGKVYPLVRRVPKTAVVAQAALEELLKGATLDEGWKGFRTNINSGVTIQSLTIESGVARADFNELLQLQVGGACRVTAIRSQIEATLKQFPTVQSVVISIDGRTEDILQP